MRKNLKISMVVSLVLGVGCADYSKMGVTPGGAQDIALVRDLIDRGQIPSMDQITSEGLFSEHDLPLSGEECEKTLCPRAGVSTFMPLDGTEKELLVQLGFGTNISAETFRRRPLNLALVVDISGSMNGYKMESVKSALSTLSEQLTSEDRVSLVAFDDKSEVRMPTQKMDATAVEELRRVIRDLDSRGGTDIERGMHMGYSEIAPSAGDDGVEHRLMLFTDAQPNIGATDVDSFLGMARYYSASGIGLSVFGVGLDLGAELASEVSKTRGGNSFYLMDASSIAKVFDEEFDFIVSPVGYDLEVRVNLGDEVVLNDIYGSTTDGQPEGFSFGASTLFLSKRNGGMGFTMRGTTQAVENLETTYASMDLSYKNLLLDRQQDSISIHNENLDRYTNDFVQANDLGVFKMAHLMYEYQALMAAAEFCENNRSLEDVTEIVQTAKERIGLAADQLNDPNLEAEYMLLEQLMFNISMGVAACSYGHYGYY